MGHCTILHLSSPNLLFAKYTVYVMWYPIIIRLMHKCSIVMVNFKYQCIYSCVWGEQHTSQLTHYYYTHVVTLVHCNLSVVNLHISLHMYCISIMWNMDTSYKIFLLWRLNMFNITCTFKYVLLEYNQCWHHNAAHTYTHTHTHTHSQMHT